MDIYPKYRKRAIVPTRSAYNELKDLRMNLFDALDVLENGYDCSRSKRSKGKIERCLRLNNHVTRVVVAEGQFVYPDGGIKEVYWLIHISVETYKKR